MVQHWGAGPAAARPGAAAPAALPAAQPPNELTARAKYTCPACGAEATWDPAKQSLICGYCGTSAPGTVTDATTGEIVEHDLAGALRGIPDSARGWRARKQSVKCQSCHAISVFDATRQSQSCEFCGSTALVPYAEVKEVFSPESLLPMKVSQVQARETIRKWYGSRWFAPSRLKKAALTDTAKGIYIPYWTFDAQVAADWEAEAGYHYFVTEEYTDASGNRQTRRVQRTRWEYASGHLDHFFDDELVPASLGIQPSHLRAVEPFPTRELLPYDAKYLSGWVVERYQLDLVAAAQRSREQMEQKLNAMCADAVPGDTYRNLRVSTHFSGQTFKHILAPLWLLQYRYGARNFQVVMNGYTGRVSGNYPKSWVKIVFAALAVIILLLILFSFGEFR